MLDYVPISLALESNPALHGHAGNTRCVNCWSEDVGDSAKHPVNVHAISGLTSFATLTGAGGGVRAMLALSDSDLYVVAGRLLFRVDNLGSAVVLGGIVSDGLVTMARNRLAPNAQIAIVCDGLYYIVQGGTLTRMGDPDLPPPVSVAQLNGYFHFLLTDGRHFASELDDEDVTALSFAAAGSNPDPGVRNWVRGQDLLIGGTRSIEAWQDVGGDPFPFSRVTNVTRAEDQTDIGVLAGGAVAGGFFVASDKTVRVLNGYSAVKISNPAVDRFISAETPAALSATTWSERGRTFYALSGATGTWTYDTSTKRWHERQSYGLARWRVQHCEAMGNNVIAGDYAAGTLYRVDADAMDEAGSTIVVVNQTPVAHGFPYRMRHNGLAIDVVPGVGIVGAASHIEAPSIMLDYSDDGGRSWSTQRTAALGEAGDSLRKVRFGRLGTSRARIYRISCSASVSRTLCALAIAAEKLSA